MLRERYQLPPRGTAKAFNYPSLIGILPIHPRLRLTASLSLIRSSEAPAYQLFTVAALASIRVGRHGRSPDFRLVRNESRDHRSVVVSARRTRVTAAWGLRNAWLQLINNARVQKLSPAAGGCGGQLRHR